MLKKGRYFAIVAILGTMIISENAMAHTTVMSKNTPDGYSTRDEREGTTSLNNFSIPHGCGGEAVRAQSVVFPNGADAIAVDKATDDLVDLAVHIIGNPIMGAKPAVNSLFDKVKKVEGPVPGFISHGYKEVDTRAFAFTKGKLEDGYLGLIPWRATFPKFRPESCATALNVHIAIANYCKKSNDEYDDDRADIWIGHPTEKFNDPDILPRAGWWPYLRVVRDLKKNPIPCGGEGFEINVYPSDEAIDEFLPIAGYWPAKGDSKDDDHGKHHKH